MLKEERRKKTVKREEPAFVTAPLFGLTSFSLQHYMYCESLVNFNEGE